jgi:hypothetical protein
MVAVGYAHNDRPVERRGRRSLQEAHLAMG